MSLAFASLGSLKPLFENHKSDNQLLPTLFVGHGSPMNAIEQNENQNYYSGEFSNVKLYEFRKI